MTTRLGAYGASRAPYGSFAGKETDTAPPAAATPANPSSAGGRISTTRGTYTPVSDIPVRKKRVKKPEAQSKPIEPYLVSELGKLANIVPFVPPPDAPIVQPITKADAESLIAAAIKAVKAELATASDAQESKAAELKTLKVLEDEVEAVLAARQVEALLLLALVE